MKRVFLVVILIAVSATLATAADRTLCIVIPGADVGAYSGAFANVYGYQTVIKVDGVLVHNKEAKPEHMNRKILEYIQAVYAKNVANTKEIEKQAAVAEAKEFTETLTVEDTVITSDVPD